MSCGVKMGIPDAKRKVISAGDTTATGVEAALKTCFAMFEINKRLKERMSILNNAEVSKSKASMRWKNLPKYTSLESKYKGNCSCNERGYGTFKV